jgi:sugar O-acyltransferase (sialic acid O-acetyltransferase NeuD family)
VFPAYNVADVASEQIRHLWVLGARDYAPVFSDVFDGVDGFRVAGFVENEDPSRCDEPLGGLPVRWIDDLSKLPQPLYAICCLGTTRRDHFVEQARRQSACFPVLVHPTAWVSGRSTLGEGTSVDVGSVLAAFSEIGAHVRIGRGVTVGHHLRIRDYATVNPGVNIASRADIGRQANLGMGANVLEGVRIGDGAVVGAGAVVTQDVPDRCLAVGVPARVVREEAGPR